MDEANDLLEELLEFAGENGLEDLCVTGFGITKLPEGDKQSDGGYCDSYPRGGTYYYPIDGSTMYMWVKYSF